MKYFTVFFSVLAFISLCTTSIFGQQGPNLEQEEAPASVWDMDIGDTEVDLYMAGYWKIGIMGGLSVESGANGIVFPAAFPGLTDFRFYQEPDITISLWLMNRFYLETSFLEGFDKNTYAIGYRGMEGEVLQSVRIGNSEILIDEYKGISVPSPKYNTPGISASFQTEKSYHDILLRYDPTSEHKKVFLGEYEITEEVLNISNYVRGQYFILPDTNIDPGSLEVYIADKYGTYTGNDGLKYKKATDNEAFYSLEDGTVTLAEPSETEVLVFYKKGGTAVGLIGGSLNMIAPLVNGEPDPGGTALAFSWAATDTWYSGTFGSTSMVNIEGRDSFKIYNPQKFGPFEFNNVYSIKSQIPEDKWRTSIVLADKNLTEAGDSKNYEYHLNIDEKTVSLFNIADTDIRKPWSRYPLADSYPIIYGTQEVDEHLTGRSILVSVKNQSGLNLGSGVIPGSEQIYINGYKTTSGIVDYASGKLTFSKYIFPQDRIVVSYRTETVDLTGGDLLFAQGNRFYPSDNLEWYVAEMFRWNIAKTTSSSIDTTSPGGLTVAGGLSYKTDNLNVDLTSTISLQTPDTIGVLRLQGMEDSGFSFSIGEALLKESPASVWDGSGYLLTTTRAYLNYYDYFTNNGLGQYFLNSYNWSGLSLDSSKNGPSVASKISSDSFDGNVMVMDYDFNTDPNERSSGDLLLSIDGPIDLSRFTSISLQLKKIDQDNDDLNLFILIGENGELEDWNNDGFINSSDSSLVVKIDVNDTYISTNNEWKPFTHQFTTSEMNKLSKSRSLRIIIEDPTFTATGKLLISDVHFEGSIFDSALYDSGDTEISADDKLNVTETTDQANSLSSAFPEITDLFHPAGEEQNVLKVEWGQPTPINLTDYWLITTHTSPVPVDSYKTFSFYIKSSTILETYTISLTNSSNKGYQFNYTPTVTSWKKLNISLETGEVTDDSGNSIPSINFDIITDPLTRFSIRKASSETSGTIYIDELHFTDPTFSLDGTVELITDYKYIDDIVTTANGFPIFSDFSIYNQFMYSGGTVLSTVSEGISTIQNSTSISFELILFALTGNFKVNWNPSQTDLSGGHSIKFPADFPYGYIYDSYSRTGSGSSVSMTRDNNIRLNIPNAGNLEFSASSNGNSNLLIQSWKSETQWEIASLFSIGALISFEQNSIWDNRDLDNYFMNWIDDYRLIAPVTESINSRGVKTSINLALRTMPVGFTLNPYLSFENEINPLSEQINRGGFTMTIPIKLFSESGNEWSIIPSYGRSFIQKSDKPLSDSFADGFNNLASDLNSWIPLTSFIPFHEIFGTSPVSVFESVTDGFNEASYSPDFGISVSRKFGSNIYDLFIPYNFNTNFIRTFGKKDDTVFDKNRIEFSFRQTAVNLFGNFGVYPFFGFYNTEEISGSMQFNLEATDNNIPQPQELIYQNYLSFSGRNNTIIIFENKFETYFIDTYISDTLDLKFIWQRPMREKFAINFLNDLINKEHYWSHEENIGFKLLYPWETNDKFSYASINIYLEHMSKLNVPDLGVLRLWLNLGFYSDPELFRAGFETGLELEVSF